MPGPLFKSRTPFIALLLAGMLLAALLLTGLLPAGCSSVRAPKPGATEPAATSEEEAPEGLWDLDAQAMQYVPVESWAVLEADEFNAAVDSAVESGETWPRDPIDVVEQFIRGGIGAYYTRLEKQDNRVEWPDSTVITLIRDRYADDSVRGDWHRITLHRLPDGTWRVAEALLAYRCYRGHQQAAYGKRLCL